MHVIQRLIDQKDDTKYHPSVAKKIRNWKDDHFAWAINYIYGIEKDYRLVKVGKVGCYLHGDGLANVIHSDGLARFSHPDYKGKLLQTDKNFPKDNKQFDMLVSNPPYSVSAFKNAARAFYKEESFDLYDSLTDNSSEIEALFVERTKQLLKDGGVAGIILPSSILSNTGIYSKTREIILQYFEIIAITELGSNTFMATGTNTVVLFLRRRNNYDSINLKKAVDKFFTDYKDVTLNGVEKPVSKYIDHVWEGLIFDDYVSLLKREPNKTIKSHEIYKEYRKKLKTKNETDFWKQVLDRETEKLFYFILAYPQKVVLIKSGQKNDEKRFLGYEFSNRRGSEGIHPIQRGKSIVECTKLFDEDNFENEEKASTYIYRAFKGDFESEIHNSLQKNISRQALVDMLTFDNIEFEKNISLAVKKKVKIESKFSLLELKEIVTFSEKGKRPASFGSERGIYPFIGSSAIIKKCDIFDYDFEAIVIGDGGSANIHYLNEKFSSSDHTYILKKKETPLKYIYFFLRQNIEIIEEGFAGQSLKNISKSFLESIKIPLPPLDIQNKIVIEIDALDKKEGKTKEEIKKLKNSFGQLFQGKNYSYKNLGSITSFKNGLNYSRSSLGEVLNIVGVKDFQNNFSPNIELLEKVQIDGQLTEEYELRPQDILVVRSNGSANLVGRFLFIENLPIGKTSFSGFTIRLRPLSDNINSKFLGHYLKTDIVRNELTGSSKGSNIKSLNQTLLSAIKIPVPSLSEQQKIVSEIEKIESKISVLEKEIAEIPKQKDKILKKFL